MVCVLAIGPKVCGFTPRRGVGFLRAIKVHSMPSFGGEVKPPAPCRKILRHVKKSLRSVKKDTSKAQFISFAKMFLICYYMTLLVGFPESSGGRLRRSPSISFHRGFPCSYVTWGWTVPRWWQQLRRSLTPSTFWCSSSSSSSCTLWYAFPLLWVGYSFSRHSVS
jgi:hypothetical protein